MVVVVVVVTAAYAASVSTLEGSRGIIQISVRAQMIRCAFFYGYATN